MEAKDKYNFISGRASAAKQQLEESTLKKQLYEEELESLQVVGWLLTEAAILTQKKLKTAYENTITAALNSVFDREHTFELEFDRRGNRLDCSALVRTGGMLLDPKNEKGGSVVDIISFTARLAEWVLGGRTSRPIFFLDEPFKNLGPSGRLDSAIAMVCNLAKTFGVQLIIITHTDQLSQIADSHYVLSHDGEKTVASRRQITSAEEASNATESIPGKPASNSTIKRVR